MSRHTGIATPVCNTHQHEDARQRRSAATGSIRAARTAG
jgi:hypothetical protein